MKNCARQARFDWLAQIFGRCVLIGHGRIFGVLYSFPKLQDAFYHTRSSITISSTNVKRRSTMADSKARKCSHCEAKKPLSAFASTGAKTRYLKTCLECRTKVKILSPTRSIY